MNFESHSTQTGISPWTGWAPKPSQEMEAKSAMDNAGSSTLVSSASAKGQENI